MAVTVAPPQALHPKRIRQRLHLSRERMARLFDVSAKTIERWEARPDLPSGHFIPQRLAQLHEIAELANIVYEPEGVRLFLMTPMPIFDNRTALQMIEEGRADNVFGALCGDYEGLGY